MQPDPDPIEHDLPAIPMLNFSCDVNVSANEINGWEKFQVDMEPSLGPFHSTLSCLFISHSCIL